MAIEAKSGATKYCHVAMIWVIGVLFSCCNSKKVHQEYVVFFSALVQSCKELVWIWYLAVLCFWYLWSISFHLTQYEEIYAPEVNDFVYITDNAYASSELRKMELDILHTLNYNLGRPLALHFLRRNSKAGEVDSVQHALAKFFMEVTLQVALLWRRPTRLARMIGMFG